MATQQQTVGEEDEGKRERREDWLLGGNAGGSIWGCGAAGEARGGVGEGWDGGHATQGGGQDVGHHHGANATLLPLSERAGLGHTNGIKHHRGSLGRGGAQWQAELGFATDRLKEDLWSCANIMYTALNEKRLIGRQEGQQLKLAPSYIELSFAAGNAPRLWRHNASPLSPGGLRSKSPDGCVRASAAPSSSPRGCESHLPGEESGGADERSSVTERAVLWGRCQWRWRRRDSPAGRWVVWGPRCARGPLGALGCRCPWRTPAEEENRRTVGQLALKYSCKNQGTGFHGLTDRQTGWAAPLWINLTENRLQASLTRVAEQRTYRFTLILQLYVSGPSVVVLFGSIL